MNIKLQGGKGSTYANKGSCTGVVDYLEHEDYKRMENGQEVEQYFNQTRDMVEKSEVTQNIDNNKAKLCKDDAKFFVITVSPSANEVKALGDTPEAQAEALKDYIRKEVIPEYAKGFKGHSKELKENDIMYYAKIHHEREKGSEVGLHAHIIVSRKDMNNKIKMSPMTTNRGEGKGTVKSSFNRTDFMKACEQGFDRHTGYQRGIKETFEYCNTMDKGSIKEREEMTAKAVQEEREQAKAKGLDPVRDLQQKKGREQNLNRNFSLGM